MDFHSSRFVWENKSTKDSNYNYKRVSESEDYVTKEIEKGKDRYKQDTKMK